VSETLKAGERRFSAHAVGEFSAGGILIGPLVDDIASTVVVEDCPDYHNAHCSDA
jgi:hypothetical protein